LQFAFANRIILSFLEIGKHGFHFIQQEKKIAFIHFSIDGGCFALFFAVFRSIYLSCVAVFLHSLHRFQVA